MLDLPNRENIEPLDYHSPRRRINNIRQNTYIPARMQFIGVIYRSISRRKDSDSCLRYYLARWYFPTISHDSQQLANHINKWPFQQYLFSSTGYFHRGFELETISVVEATRAATFDSRFIYISLRRTKTSRIAASGYWPGSLLISECPRLEIF